MLSFLNDNQHIRIKIREFHKIQVCYDLVDLENAHLYRGKLFRWKNNEFNELNMKIPKYMKMIRDNSILTYFF